MNQRSIQSCLKDISNLSHKRSCFAILWGAINLPFNFRRLINSAISTLNAFLNCFGQINPLLTAELANTAPKFKRTLAQLFSQFWL